MAKSRYFFIKINRGDGQFNRRIPFDQPTGSSSNQPNPTLQMKKVNLQKIAETPQKSPTGKFRRFSKEISVGLGREPNSTDLAKQHPFDMTLVRVLPGAKAFPYHLHSAQWEFYIIVSGRGEVRDKYGRHKVRDGDAFQFPPGEAHQITNPGKTDLVYYVIADNPTGETCYYPDSNKWLVHRGHERVIGKITELDYFHGED